MAFSDVLTRLEGESISVQRGVDKHFVYVQRSDLIALLEQFSVIDEIARSFQREAAEHLKDTQRLNFLDQLNEEFNQRMGTNYGWSIDWNCNRIALHDMDAAGQNIREAIDKFSTKKMGVD